MNLKMMECLRDALAEDIKGGVGGEVVKKLQVFKRNNHVPSRASKKSFDYKFCLRVIELILNQNPCVLGSCATELEIRIMNIL